MLTVHFNECSPFNLHNDPFPTKLIKNDKENQSLLIPIPESYLTPFLDVDIHIHIGSGFEESFRGQIIKDRGELWTDTQS